MFRPTLFANSGPSVSPFQFRIDRASGLPVALTPVYRFASPLATYTGFLFSAQVTRESDGVSAIIESAWYVRRDAAGLSTIEVAGATAAIFDPGAIGPGLLDVSVDVATNDFVVSYAGAPAETRILLLSTQIFPTRPYPVEPG